jgi:hypothetical protein
MDFRNSARVILSCDISSTLDISERVVPIIKDSISQGVAVETQTVVPASDKIDGVSASDKIGGTHSSDSIWGQQ